MKVNAIEGNVIDRVLAAAFVTHNAIRGGGFPLCIHCYINIPILESLNFSQFLNNGRVTNIFPLPTFKVVERVLSHNYELGMLPIIYI